MHRDLNKPKKLKRQVTLRKIAKLTVDDISRRVHAVILAGGPQNNPLARFRAMPAVELGEVQLATGGMSAPDCLMVAPSWLTLACMKQEPTHS